MGQLMSDAAIYASEGRGLLPPGSSQRSVSTSWHQQKTHRFSSPQTPFLSPHTDKHTRNSSNLFAQSNLRQLLAASS